MASLTAFPFSRTITIDTTGSGANVSSSLTDFPVCIVVNSSSWTTQANRDHFFDASNTSGKRVQFYSGSTSLSYEVETYDATGGTAVYWVKVPSIAGTSTTSISVGYGGDPNGSDQSNGTATWDSSYKAVWHLAGTANNTDSTTNGHTLTFGTAGVSDYIGLGNKGVSFDGTAGRAQFARTAAVTMSGGSTFTIMAHTNIAATPGTGTTPSIYNSYGGTGAGSYGGIDFRIQNLGGTASVRLIYLNSSGTEYGVSTNLAYATATDYVWHGRLLGGTATWYSQGAASASAAAAGTLGNSNRGTVDIADAGKLFNAAEFGRYYNGAIGELRLSNVGRSADLVKAEYFSLKQTSWAGDGWISFATETANARPYVVSIRQAVTRSAVF